MLRRAFLGGLAVAARAVRAADARVLHAGAATSNITPALGCSLAGGMTDRIGTEVHDELHSKALVLDNGNARLANRTGRLVRDPASIIDGAKKLIAEHAKIPPSHCADRRDAHA